MSTLTFDLAELRADLAAEAASSRRPVSRQIADVFESIDHAIRSGVSRLRVLEVLAARGITASMAQLDKYLWRLRRRRKEASGGVAATPTGRSQDRPAEGPETGLQAGMAGAAQEVKLAPGLFMTPYVAPEVAPVSAPARQRPTYVPMTEAQAAEILNRARDEALDKYLKR